MKRNSCRLLFQSSSIPHTKIKVYKVKIQHCKYGQQVFKPKDTQQDRIIYTRIYNQGISTSALLDCFEETNNERQIVIICALWQTIYPGALLCTTLNSTLEHGW